jgi:hypothetical protein
MRTKNKCGYGTHINLDISFCRYYLCHCSEISTCPYKRERVIRGTLKVERAKKMRGKKIASY